MTERDASGAAWALRFVSGKYQGGLFPLREGREVLIGRSSELDLVLVEDNVSRRHAKLVVRGGAVTLQDLGSTNGTFVNGVRVKKARLKEGDRVLIGGAILKLVRAEASAGAQTDAEIREGLEAAARVPRPPGVTGRLEEIPLPDLLQLLGSARKSGVLVLRRDGEEAAIHVREGRATACTISGREGLAPRKAFFRTLRWERGEFELAPPADPPAGATLDEPLEALLLDGMRQADELRALGDSLRAAAEARVEVVKPLPRALRSLEPDELDVLQAAMTRSSVQAILDGVDVPDARTLRVIDALVEKGLLRRS